MFFLTLMFVKHIPSNCSFNAELEVPPSYIYPALASISNSVWTCLNEQSVLDFHFAVPAY